MKLTLTKFLIEKYIVESFKDAQLKFSQNNDPQVVAKTLADFRSIAQRLPPEQKDITKWMNRPFSELVDVVSSVKNTPSKRVAKKSVKDDAIQLGTLGGWTLIVPTSEQSSCAYGAGTKWCTAARDDNWFNSYFLDSEVTIVYLIDGDHKFAFSLHTTGDYQMFDEEDNSLELDEFEDMTGLDVNELLQLIEDNAQLINTMRVKRLKLKNSEKIEEIREILNRVTPSAIREMNFETIQSLVRKLKDAGIDDIDMSSAEDKLYRFAEDYLACQVRLDSLNRAIIEGTPTPLHISQYNGHGWKELMKTTLGADDYEYYLELLTQLEARDG